MEEENHDEQVFVDQEFDPEDYQLQEKPKEKFNGQKKYKNLKLLEKVKTYFSKPQKYKEKDFVQLFGLHCKNAQNKKSVCAKIISPNETIAECYNCRADSSCIICMDCYKNGNHEGHKVVYKKAFGGCCDCGDAQAWKPEGFCKDHTGQAVEIDISNQEIQHFCSIFTELFYLYFRQNLMGNLNNFIKFGQSLIQNLQYINGEGVYYNKLTYIMFQKNLPNTLKLSENAEKRTILQNILCPITSGNIGKQWMQVFILMFPYYPFKKLLLKTYIKSYSIIYNASQQSQNNGASISCQLMTSYQLVRQYALEEGNIPIGNDVKLKNLKEFQRVFFYVMHDLNYTCKLQGDTPLVYWRFHINNNFLKLFQYAALIHKSQWGSPQDSVTLKLAKYVKYFHCQFVVLECMSKVATVIKEDRQLLQKAIKILYDEAIQNTYSDSMIIFKPIQRTLCLFLFAYVDFNLENILKEDFSQNLIQKVLKTNKQSFTININKMLKGFLKTYLYYSKILAQPGLNSTLYPYVYYYRTKCRFVSALDIVWLKFLVLIKQSEPVITIKNYIQNTDKQITKIESSHFILLLNQLKIAVVSKSSQIYLTYQINPTSILYQYEIEQLLKRILSGEKSLITIQIIKQYQQAFFHPNVNLIEYMKKLCTFDKIKKVFILNKQNQTELTLNYQDFRCNLTNKTTGFQNPQKSISLIQKSYNVQIHQKLWSIQTMKKTLIFGIQIIKAFLNKQAQIDHLKVILLEICKILYEKRKISNNQKTQQQLDIILRLLKKVEGIEPLLDNFYLRQFYSQKMQLEEPHDNQQKQKERKRILKQKMQIKKKMIKQKYNMQSQNFVAKQEKKLNEDKENNVKPQAQNQNRCIICRHQHPTDIVYLTNFSYKNHQKLLGMGQGTLTLSIQSCFHILDYTCYKKMKQKIKKNNVNQVPTLQCPFCKFTANSYLPAQANSPHLDEAIKNSQMIIFMLKNLDEISMTQQLLKSFYHYSLLGILDPQRTINKRSKIQKLILQILKKNKQYFSGLQKIFSSFLNNKINLRPKQSKAHKKKNPSKQQILLSFMQNSINQGGNQLLDDMDVQDYEQYLQNLDNSQGEQSQGFFSKLNELKDKLIKKKSQKVEEREIQEMTPIMRRTLSLVFQYLGFKSQSKLIQEQTNPYVEYCLRQLFDEKQQNLILTSLKSQQNNNLLKLRELPLKYLPLSKFTKCDVCQQISSSLCICLLCDWKGCLKHCIKDKKLSNKSGCFTHSSQHGENCLFLSILKCEVYLLDQESGISLGVIYKDEWGNDFSVKKDWDQFFLDEFLLQKIKISFLHDEKLN